MLVLNALETAVLDMLLAGDHPVLACLREQRAAATIVSRSFSGVGFFVDFAVPDSAARCGSKPDYTLSDVEATIDGLAHGAGFVIFVRDGRITMLEGFCYDE